MRGSELGDLVAFLAVAEELSFTRAAAKLRISQSALSYTVRRLETRLGLRLLNRTTRSVAPTDAGDRLLRTLRPAFDQIDTELEAVGELRDKPAGTVRLTASDHAADKILWPAVARIVRSYPEIKVEINVDYGLTDIVTDRYDAGVRFGDQVAKDMIAVRIGPDLRMAIVGAPSYFATRPEPKSPQDLVNHSCINFRQPSAGGLYSTTSTTRVAGSSPPRSTYSSARCASNVSRSIELRGRELVQSALDEHSFWILGIALRARNTVRLRETRDSPLNAAQSSPVSRARMSPISSLEIARASTPPTSSGG